MRRRSLDLLRCVAVVLVLFRHFDAVSISMKGDLAYEAVQYLQRIGWIGVDLFFVLSGFLISNLIFEEIDRTGKFSVGRFLIRRGLKIYPSFYVFILATGILLYLKGQLLISTFLSELFYVQNYFRGLWNHTWSLAVEEHFYVFLALAFVFLLRVQKMDVRNPKFQRILISLILFSIGLKILYVNSGAISIYAMYFTHFRMDSLLFGVFLAWLFRYENAQFVSSPFLGQH